jgi:hypothetical protein
VDGLAQQELFSLELVIGQIVYVQSNSSILTLEEVTNIVETGFSRGDGGRLRFRSLLVSNPYFRTVVNIEVLDNPLIPIGLTSATPSRVPISNIPHATTSIIPTSSPTKALTGNPFSQTSSAPTVQINESMGPTFTGTPSEHPTKTPMRILSPSSTPSHSPTVVPSHRPVQLSASPSTEPEQLSNAPSAGPLPRSSDNTRSGNRQTVIVGGIIGGVAFVFASLFLIFCILYPFCIRRKTDNEQDDDNGSGSFPGLGSTVTTSTQTMAVPGVLTLDDDAQSLANTTLDGKSSAQAISPNQSAGSVQRIHMTESFDESSIYTSMTDPSTLMGNDTIQQPTPQSSSGSIDGAMRKSAVDGFHDSDVLSSPHPFSQGEHLGAITGLDINKPDTKGFDPFDDEHYADDESSFEFGSSMALSDPSFGTPPGNKTSALTFDETKRIENLNGTASHPSLSSSDVGGDAITNWQVDSIVQSNNGASDNVETSSKTVLEHFLSDAYANTTSTASKSVSSMQSAPSRLVAPQSSQEPQIRTFSNGRPPQHGHHRTGTDQTATTYTKNLSSRSVGASVRSRLLRSSNNMFHGSKYDHPHINGDTNDFRTSAYNSYPHIARVPSTSGFNDPFLDEYVGLQMPSTGDNSLSNGKLYHVAPRQTMSVASYRDESDSPTMTSSRFGNYSSGSSMYDSSSASGRSGSWLFDTDEHTLDSDPRVGDFQSASSRSSRMSRKSKVSTESGRYSQSRRNGTNREQRQSGVRTTGGVMNGSNKDEQKSADHAAGPYSWQSALRHYGPSSISGSSSTGSGSRSTLSSRVDTQYKEQYEVLAPPGKINIVLVTDFHNGNGTVISEVRSSSALQGKLHEGDELGKTLLQLL